jgi:hypothetical protein
MKVAIPCVEQFSLVGVGLISVVGYGANSKVTSPFCVGVNSTGHGVIVNVPPQVAVGVGVGVGGTGVGVILGVGVGGAGVGVGGPGVGVGVGGGGVGVGGRGVGVFVGRGVAVGTGETVGVALGAGVTRNGVGEATASPGKRPWSLELLQALTIAAIATTDNPVVSAADRMPLDTSFTFAQKYRRPRLPPRGRSRGPVDDGVKPTPSGSRSLLRARRD